MGLWSIAPDLEGVNATSGGPPDPGSLRGPSLEAGSRKRGLPPRPNGWRRRRPRRPEGHGGRGASPGARAPVAPPDAAPASRPPPGRGAPDRPGEPPRTGRGDGRPPVPRRSPQRARRVTPVPSEG